MILGIGITDAYRGVQTLVQEDYNCLSIPTSLGT